MNDDGMVEVSEGSFSIEPMLWVHDRLVTWSDVVSRQELLEEWMPVPSVLWETAEWRLRIRPRPATAAYCVSATGSRTWAAAFCQPDCSC